MAENYKNKFCSKCGKENTVGNKLCYDCESDVLTFLDKNNQIFKLEKPMTFSRSISSSLKKFFSFNGRASRAEFFWFNLFVILVSFLSLIVDSSGIFATIINFFISIPSFSVTVRRLHDNNRSGWWLLLAFTFIGFIPLTVWLTKEGSDKANDYGAPSN